MQNSQVDILRIGGRRMHGLALCRYKPSGKYPRGAKYQCRLDQNLPALMVPLQHAEQENQTCRLPILGRGRWWKEMGLLDMLI